MYRIHPSSRLFAIVATAVILSPITAAQEKRAPSYKLLDLGTFGGPHSSAGGSQTIVLNNRRIAVGGADTTMVDPYSPLCFDLRSCLVEHTFRWHDGVLQDLGALPAGSSSIAYAINESGLIVGWSQNGVVDPITGVPAYVPTVWKNSHVIDLGTFGGPFGVATAVNDAGFVVGTAQNTTADPFRMVDLLSDPNLSAAPDTTELHAFGWTGNRIFELGTLGGPGAIPLYVNNRGWVTGTSFTSFTPGPSGIPQLDPFLWKHGVMIDLGTLGGTFGVAAKVSDCGQVVGDSDLEGDLSSHGFSWKDGVLTDIGTLGGDFSTAKWVNERGEVVGFSSTPSGLFKAFRWRNGRMRDLGAVGSDLCSAAWSINDAGQIVGNSSKNCQFKDERGFLWENGHMFDLNSFVPQSSDLYLFEAEFINERGDITGPAVLSNGDRHQYLLLRCNSENFEGCQGPDTHLSRSAPYRPEIAPTRRRTINGNARNYISRLPR